MSELTMSNMKDRVGSELGVSDWMLVDQERINEFADCTGDRQWIHVDAERAKRESPFGGPVAHGYLTLSLIGPLSLDVGVVPSDAAAGFNYGLDKVRFLAPVPAGAARETAGHPRQRRGKKRRPASRQDEEHHRNRKQRQACSDRGRAGVAGSAKDGELRGGCDGESCRRWSGHGGRVRG